MYNNIYGRPKLKAEITLTKILMSVIAFFAFFVLPIQIITYYTGAGAEDISNGGQADGRVAGVSTDSNLEKNESIINIDLSDKSTQYLIVGVSLGIVGVILMGYMYYDHITFKSKLKE